MSFAGKQLGNRYIVVYNLNPLFTFFGRNNEISKRYFFSGSIITRQIN